MVVVGTWSQGGPQITLNFVPVNAGARSAKAGPVRGLWCAVCGEYDTHAARYNDNRNPTYRPMGIMGTR